MGAIRLTASCHHGQRRNQVAKPRGVLAEQIGGHERSGKAAQPEEDIQKIQRRPAMSRVNIAAESIGRGDNDPASGAEQKQMTMRWSENRWIAEEARPPAR